MRATFGQNYPILSTAALTARSADRQKFIIIAAVVLIASVSTILFLLYTASSGERSSVQVIKDADPVPAAVGTVTLLAPEGVVRAGAPLSSVIFKEIYWPRTQVPEGAVRDVAELRSLFARNDLQPGMPVVRGNLTREQARASLPVRMGDRAVTIAVDDSRGVEGFALPGTRVDVVLTFMSAGQLTSQVIVDNATVLSLGGDSTLGGQAGSERARLGRRASSTITLNVSTGDALKLQTARQLGNLSLTLRNSEDDKVSSVLAKNQHDLDGPRDEERGSSQHCASRGHLKIGSKEFVVGCDSSFSQLLNRIEP